MKKSPLNKKKQFGYNDGNDGGGKGETKQN